MQNDSLVEPVIRGDAKPLGGFSGKSERAPLNSVLALMENDAQKRKRNIRSKCDK